MKLGLVLQVSSRGIPLFHCIVCVCVGEYLIFISYSVHTITIEALNPFYKHLKTHLHVPNALHCRLAPEMKTPL